MLTWAMVYFFSRSDVHSYQPWLFVIALGCDMMIAKYGATAYLGRPF